MKNILFLTSWYPTLDAPHKGVFVREHAQAIAAAGNRVCVVVLNVSNGSGLCTISHELNTENDGSQVHMVSIRSRWHKKIHAVYPLLRRVLLRYIKTQVVTNFNPDIVHSNVLYPAGMIGHELALSLKVPHIITEHWSKADRFLRKNIFASKGKAAYARAAAVTCVSRFLMDRISGYLVEMKQKVIIPNVVRSEFFRYKPKTPGKELVVVAVATWQSPKRPELFINALEQIAKNDNRKIRLHLFGDGIQLIEFRNRKFHSGFSIDFHGYADKETIGRQIQSADFFVHASEIETFSIVVAEALCSGTPVICSNRGALPELVPAENGVLCENTPHDWENKIRLALERKFDHEAISLNYSEKFSPTSIGEAFTRLYLNVTANEVHPD